MTPCRSFICISSSSNSLEICHKWNNILSFLFHPISCLNFSSLKTYEKIKWVVSMTWAPEHLAWSLATSFSATSTVVKTVGNAAASIWDHDVGRWISNFGSCQFKIPRKSSWYPTENEAPNSSLPTTLWNQTRRFNKLPVHQFWTCKTRLTIFTFGGAIRATCSCYANIVLKLDADYRCTFTVLFSYKFKKMDTCDMIKSLTWPDTKLCPKPTTQTATVQKSTLWLSLPPFWFEWHFSVYISPPDFW